MTDEIIKLYKNAGIEPKYVKGENLMGYSYGTLKYLPFTAEKQIEIVKAISTNYIRGYYDYRYLRIDREEIYEEIYLYLCIDSTRYHAHDKDFAVALAKLVNLIWHDLTKEEKEYIRGILKEGEAE